MKANHKILGIVEITEACEQMQKQNCDSTTMYIEHDGEIKEVSKTLVIVCE